jgi:hypothetical protein
MQLLIQAVAALGILIAGVALIFASIELRRLRLRLQTGVLRVLVEPETPVGCCRVIGSRGSSGGYAIYVYRKGAWVLEEDFSVHGYEAAPPGMDGSYEKEAVTTQSIPKRAR